PGLARWANCGPSTNNTARWDSNLLAYCLCDPIGITDPDGRDILVLKESALTAEQFVKLVKGQAAIPEAIRKAFSVNPKDPSKIHISRANRRYSSPEEAKSWDWLYQELERAAASDRFALTTGQIKRAS